MNFLKFFYIFAFLFFTVHSSQDKVQNELSRTFILTEYPNIVREIFYFLEYSEIQKVFKCMTYTKTSSGILYFLKINHVNLKKASIYLSVLHNILSSTPCKFEKRIFNSYFYEEYVLSEDNS